LEDLGEGWELIIGKEREGVIRIGVGSTLRTTAVVTKLTSNTSRVSSGLNHAVDKVKYLVDNKKRGRKSKVKERGIFKKG
jgi:hypothetical protein